MLYIGRMPKLGEPESMGSEWVTEITERWHRDHRGIEFSSFMLVVTKAVRSQRSRSADLDVAEK